MKFMYSLPILIGLFWRCYSAILKTNDGLLDGDEVIAENGRLIHKFKKIPFAAPPVGKLRFAEAEPAIPWKGVRNAKEYGPACLQNTSRTTRPQKNIAEDCLFTNVFVSDYCMKSGNCPVAFFLYGGNYASGNAGKFDDNYIVRNFASNDVVFIISAYRLSFAAQLTFDNDEVVPYNLGLHDVIYSLQWVHKNIGSFGGNGSDITFFGHSSGATAGILLAFAKGLHDKRKLFQSLIAMSPQVEFADTFARRNVTWELAFQAECTSVRNPINPSKNFVQEVVNCLRRKDAFELLRIQRSMDDNGMSFEGIVLEKPFLTAHAFDDLNRNPPSIPMMSGITTKEFDFIAPTRHLQVNYILPLQIAHRMELMGYKHPNALTKKFLDDAKDPQRNPAIFDHTSGTASTFLSVISALHAMRRTGTKVYLYQYANRKHPDHVDDLSYLVGIHKFELDENEEVLADLYPQFFVNFIKTGEPHEVWKPLDEHNTYFNIDVDVNTGRLPYSAKYIERDFMEYWYENLSKYDEELSAQHYY